MITYLLNSGIEIKPCLLKGRQVFKRHHHKLIEACEPLFLHNEICTYLKNWLLLWMFDSSERWTGLCLHLIIGRSNENKVTKQWNQKQSMECNALFKMA